LFGCAEQTTDKAGNSVTQIENLINPEVLIDKDSYGE